MFRHNTRPTRSESGLDELPEEKPIKKPFKVRFTIFLLWGMFLVNEIVSFIYDYDVYALNVILIAIISVYYSLSKKIELIGTNTVIDVIKRLKDESKN